MSNTPTNSGNDSSQIAKGTVIKGKITSTENIRVDGIVDGTLQTTGKLIVGTDGKISGTLKSNETIVAGKLSIEKMESGKVDFRSSAHFKGEMIYQKISIEEGAVIEGNMIQKKK